MRAAFVITIAVVATGCDGAEDSDADCYGYVDPVYGPS